MLKDAYEDRKAEQTGFSYRSMAALMGTDAGYLHRVLGKEFHLPPRCLPMAQEFLGLTGRGREYFQMLFAYSRTRGRKEKQEILEKAMALRDVERRALEVRELDFFKFWWGAGIRCLLEVLEGRSNPEEISARLQPSIPAAEVQRTLNLLLDLGLVRKTASGKLGLAEAHLTAGGESKAQAVRAYQSQVLDLAKESLERFSPAVRDISTLSVAVDAEAFEDIRELLRDCRRRIQKRVEDVSRPDQVQQLAMAIFPLAPRTDK